MFNGEFWLEANAIAVCLRKKESLTTEMCATIPKMTTRLLALGNNCKWQMYHPFFYECNKAITKLQGQQLLLLYQQNEYIDALLEALSLQTDSKKESILNVVGVTGERSGVWSVSYDDVSWLLNDQGTFVREQLDKFSEGVVLDTNQHIGRFIVDMMGGIMQIKTLRDSENSSIMMKVPIILPHQLRKLRRRC
uniref:Uncharacterized protein n=1 Tax=Peronospora matthiolae TaxID=2874970 RepID=A0AAV1VF07_9STRA